MRFRPCIDIHNGNVKQIVGSSLNDTKNRAVENFVSKYDGSYYGNKYKKDQLPGGHVIILNSAESEYYEASKEQAFKALAAYKGGLQVGGGINDKNAMEFIEKGASHVIVTSFVFKDGKIDYDNLYKIYRKVGKEKLVLDLSCRKKDNVYYIVTDRWQKFTNVKLEEKIMYELSGYCDEFLIHAVDVEGKNSGIEAEVVGMLGKLDGVKATYAGGISSYEDIEKIKELGKGKVDFTIGSALDIFGGKLKYDIISKIM
ncbi:MAG: phosphoribosylformimino-5-aminoimidazole carboxamide ribotide isomerase [Lachnospiraceae bacterium]|nr:phosphoribosylformimino-5-aminoimidazole carboxamide ribotide isomerase [Lachnospiraceae bacterium]